MLNKEELLKLKDDVLKSHKIASDALISLSEAFTSHESVKLPEGFNLKANVTKRYSRIGDGNLTLSLRLREESMLEGMPTNKYFWTSDSYLDFNVSDGEINPKDFSNISGGLNKTYYGDKAQPDIGMIESTQLVLELNTIYLKTMKIATNSPELVIKPLREYVDAYETFDNLNDQYAKEVDIVKAYKKENDLKTINEVFKKVPSKSVDRMMKELKDPDSTYNKVSFVNLEMEGYSDLTSVNLITIGCQKSARTTFNVKVGSEKEMSIKASEVPEMLAMAQVFNGKRLESVVEFKEAYENEINFDDNFNSRRISLEFDELLNASKKIKSQTPEVKIKNTIRPTNRPS